MSVFDQVKMLNLTGNVLEKDEDKGAPSETSTPVKSVKAATGGPGQKEVRAEKRTEPNIGEMSDWAEECDDDSKEAHPDGEQPAHTSCMSMIGLNMEDLTCEHFGPHVKYGSLTLAELTQTNLTSHRG